MLLLLLEKTSAVTLIHKGGVQEILSASDHNASVHCVNPCVGDEKSSISACPHDGDQTYFCPSDKAVHWGRRCVNGNWEELPGMPYSNCPSVPCPNQCVGDEKSPISACPHDGDQTYFCPSDKAVHWGRRCVNGNWEELPGMPYSNCPGPIVVGTERPIVVGTERPLAVGKCFGNEFSNVEAYPKDGPQSIPCPNGGTWVRECTASGWQSPEGKRFTDCPVRCEGDWQNSMSATPEDGEQCYTCEWDSSFNWCRNCARGYIRPEWLPVSGRSYYDCQARKPPSPSPWGSSLLRYGYEDNDTTV